MSASTEFRYGAGVLDTAADTDEMEEDGWAAGVWLGVDSGDGGDSGLGDVDVGGFSPGDIGNGPDDGPPRSGARDRLVTVCRSAAGRLSA